MGMLIHRKRNKADVTTTADLELNKSAEVETKPAIDTKKKVVKSSKKDEV